MHYLLLYDVVDDYAARRLPFRAAHLAHAQAAVARGELLLGGAFADPVDGAALLFRADSPLVAEMFAAEDPYVINGLITRWRVRTWNTVVGEVAAVALHAPTEVQPDRWQSDLIRLLGGRKGHFRYESGHHGNLWLEIPRLYLRPDRLKSFATELASRLAGHDVEVVCGPMVEGAFLAQMVAGALAVEFCFAEQLAQASQERLYSVAYRIPQALQSAMRGKRVAIIDDVINAGSAVRGAVAALQTCGARIVALGALMVLGRPAFELAANWSVPLECLSQGENTLWDPSTCPMCSSGVPLEGLPESSL